MEKTLLDQLAEVLVPGYLDTALFSRRFREDHGQPPTLLAKVHHMRACWQASIVASDRFELNDQYTEFGRVEILDRETSQRYLLRSDGAAAIEHSKRQGSFFDTTRYLQSEIILVVYDFQKGGMDLSIAGSRQQAGRSHLEATAPATYVGTWPYFTDTGALFDQGHGDAFEELGDIGDESEDGEAK